MDASADRSFNGTLDFSMLNYATESTLAKTPKTLKDELWAVNRELASMKNQWRTAWYVMLWTLHRSFINYCQQQTLQRSRAHLLKVKADENAATIEHLRHKHSLLVVEHKKLQQHFNKTMEVCILYSCPITVDFVESYHTANGQAERRAMSISEISQWQVSHTQPAKAQD